MGNTAFAVSSTIMTKLGARNYLTTVCECEVLILSIFVFRELLQSAILQRDLKLRECPGSILLTVPKFSRTKMQAIPSSAISYGNTAKQSQVQELGCRIFKHQDFLNSSEISLTCTCIHRLRVENSPPWPGV